jgi:type III secretion protein D
MTLAVVPDKARPARWVLKVLGAPVEKSCDLAEGTPVKLGRSFASDVVLRDPSVEGVSVCITVEDDVGKLELVQGTVSLLGQRLQAPSMALLPPYTPLAIGAVAIAFGEPDSARWMEARRLARLMREPAAKPPTAAGEPESRWAQRWSAFGLGRLLVHGLIGLCIAICVASAIGLAWVFESQAAAQTSVAGLRHGLAAQGFGTLRVSLAPDGTALVTGLVSNGAARTRLQAVLQQAGARARLSVTYPPDLSQVVEDMFRSAGLPCQVIQIKPGRLVASCAAAADPGAVDSLGRQALRKTAAVRGLEMDIARGAAPRDGSVLAKDSIVNDPEAASRKVIAAGAAARGYLVMADGSKYFSGSQLPTGQTLKNVEPDSIVFEADGLITRVNYKGRT